MPVRDPIENPPHEEIQRARDLFLDSTSELLAFLVLVVAVYPDPFRSIRYLKLTLLLVYFVIWVVKNRFGGKWWNRIYPEYKKLRFRKIPRLFGRDGN